MLADVSFKNRCDHKISNVYNYILNKHLKIYKRKEVRNPTIIFSNKCLTPL